MVASNNRLRRSRLSFIWLVLLTSWLTACGDPLSRPPAVVTATPVARPTATQSSPKVSPSAALSPTFTPPPTFPAKIQSWYSSGLRLVKDSLVCFDKAEPNTALVSTVRGAFSYSLTTHHFTQLSVYPIAACSAESSLLFTIDRASGQVYRLKPEPVLTEEPISYLPTVLAHDGSAQVYSLQANGEDADFRLNRLYYSSDGGQSWQERGLQFGGRVISVMTDWSAANQVYVIVAGDPLPKNYLATISEIPHHFSIYASHDSGLSWEKRFESQTTPANGTYATYAPSFSNLSNIPGTMFYSIASGSSPSSSGGTYYLSTDGGYTFSPVGVGGNSSYHGPFQLFQTSQGLLKRQSGAYNNSGDSISRDMGKSWQTLNSATSLEGILWQASANPDTFFSSGAKLAQSKDAGQHWQILSNQSIQVVGITPYNPIILLGIDSNYQLYWLNPDL